MENLSNKLQLSVIIVNYNSTKHLNRLLLSLGHIDEILKEIIIIDNNSNDIGHLSCKNLSKIFLIHNQLNIGFAKAVNQGIMTSTSDYILLLNPDTIVPKNNGVREMFKFAKSNKDIAIIGGRIISKRQKYTANTKPTIFTAIFEFTNLKKIFPNNKYSRSFWPEMEYNLPNPLEVDSLCGAFILFTKKTNGHTNLFDESYFLYLEDLDFCLSLRNQGKKVIFYPISKINHIGGASNTSKYNIVLKHWYKSRRYFFRKMLGRIQGEVVSAIFATEEIILTLYHYFRNEENE